MGDNTLKIRWTVEFEWPEDEDFENEESHVTKFEDRGLVRWRFGSSWVLIPWKVISKVPVEASP